jgi:hypothetical protein
LDNSQGRFQAEGSINFSRTLNLRIHPSIFHATTTLASVPPPSFLLGGTVEAPSVVLPTPPATETARPAARVR